MINKIVRTPEAAVADIRDGATVMIGGFGTAGMPSELIDALIAQGARDLTIVNNNAGNGDIGLAALLKAKRVRKIICSFPRQVDSHVFDGLYRAGEIELELTPQGNLAERIRAAGAGIGGFFTPTGYGTLLAEGKETRLINGRHYVLESPIHADFALIKFDQCEIRVKRRLEHVMPAVDQTRFLAFGELRAVAGRREKSADARAGRADALGQI